MKRILYDQSDRVAKYVADKLGMPDGFARYQAIGLEEDGRLIAGAVYTDYTKHNIFVHLAAEPGCRWMTRKFLGVGFRFPFLQLGVDRITGWVEDTNTAAKRLDEHLGYKEEGRLKGAARDGSDVILYVMWKKDCKYLEDRYVR